MVVSRSRPLSAKEWGGRLSVIIVMTDDEGFLEIVMILARKCCIAASVACPTTGSCGIEVFGIFVLEELTLKSCPTAIIN